MLSTVPCPFCGSRYAHNVRKKLLPRRTYSHYNVYCDVCSGRGPVSESRKGAVQRWNMRVQENST